MVELAVPGPRQPVAHHLTAGGLQRRGAGVRGEMVLGREPTHIPDLAEQFGGQHRTDAEQLHQAGLGLGDRGRDARLDHSDPPVQLAHVGDELNGQLTAGDRRRAGRSNLVEQRGGAVGGQVAASTSWDQVDQQPVQPVDGLGTYTEPGPRAGWSAGATPPPDLRRRPAAASSRCQRRPPPRPRHRDRSYARDQSTAPAPGRPAWLAHRPPAPRSPPTPGRGPSRRRARPRPPRTAAASSWPTGAGSGSRRGWLESAGGPAAGRARRARRRYGRPCAGRRRWSQACGHPSRDAGRNHQGGHADFELSSPLLSHSWSGAGRTAQPFWSQPGTERQWGLWSDLPAPWNPTAADLRLLPRIQ
jgi:hypothetical protein